MRPGRRPVKNSEERKARARLQAPPKKRKPPEKKWTYGSEQS